MQNPQQLNVSSLSRRTYAIRTNSNAVVVASAYQLLHAWNLAPIAGGDYLLDSLLNPPCVAAA